MKVSRQLISNFFGSPCKKTRIALQELMKLGFRPLEAELVAHTLHLAVDALHFAQSEVVDLLRRHVDCRARAEEIAIRGLSTRILREANRFRRIRFRYGIGQTLE